MNQRRTPLKIDRCGFTLVELLIVLGIVASLGMIVLPRIDRRMQRAEHRAAAEGLQSALLQLRQRAIETGRAHTFRFLPGTGEYEVRAAAVDEVGQIDFDSVSIAQRGPASEEMLAADPTELAPHATIVRSPGEAEWTEAIDSQESSNREGDDVEVRRLRNGLSIHTSDGLTRVAETGVDSSAPSFEEPSVEVDDNDFSLDGLADGNQESTWSNPITFFPDGRAEDATLFVVAPTGYAIEITVVGITGLVRVAPDRRLLPSAGDSGDDVEVDRQEASR